MGLLGKSPPRWLRALSAFDCASIIVRRAISHCSCDGNEAKAPGSPCNSYHRYEGGIGSVEGLDDLGKVSKAAREPVNLLTASVFKRIPRTTGSGSLADSLLEASTSPNANVRKPVVFGPAALGKIITKSEVSAVILRQPCSSLGHIRVRFRIQDVRVNSSFVPSGKRQKSLNPVRRRQYEIASASGIRNFETASNPSYSPEMRLSR